MLEIKTEYIILGMLVTFLFLFLPFVHGEIVTNACNVSQENIYDIECNITIVAVNAVYGNYTNTANCHLRIFYPNGTVVLGYLGMANANQDGLYYFPYEFERIGYYQVIFTCEDPGTTPNGTTSVWYHVVENTSRDYLGDINETVESINETVVVINETVAQINETITEIQQVQNNTILINYFRIGDAPYSMAINENITVYLSVIDGDTEPLNAKSVNLTLYGPDFNTLFSNENAIRQADGFYYYRFIPNESYSYGSYLLLATAFKDGNSTIGILSFKINTTAVVEEEVVISVLPSGESLSVTPKSLSLISETQIQVIKIVNTGSITVTAEFIAYGNISNILMISPLRKIISPNQIVKVELKFYPEADKYYSGYVNIELDKPAGRENITAVGIKMTPLKEPYVPVLVGVVNALSRWDILGALGLILTSLFSAFFIIPKIGLPIIKIFFPIIVVLVIYLFDRRRKEELRISWKYWILIMLVLSLAVALLLPTI